MADIVNKSAGATSEWRPMRAMRDLFRWDPFREMSPFAASPEEVATFSPSFEVAENKDAYLFKADVPGITKENLEIRTDTIYTYERQYGSFCRSFTLPEGADLEHARSELKDGVLTLAVPKKPDAQSKKIAISTTVKS